jgi:hypothetical protein
MMAATTSGAGASANEPEARAVQFSSRRVCTSAAASARNSCTKPIREKNFTISISLQKCIHELVEINIKLSCFS